MSRALKLAAFSAGSIETREETLNEENYLVVPVVALVEGVLHAMNSATPEMVLAEEFTRPAVVGGFNGRPLYHGHPVVNGEPVSGNDPKIYEDLCIGKVFHAAVKNNKLVMEAWVNIARAAKIAPDLLQRIAEGSPIEISVGIFCESDEEETGEFNGKKFAGSWRDIVPDHLALLVEGDTGACSREMGCGVRAAKADDEFRTLRKIPMSERDKMADEDFAGPNRSFPIAEPEDVSAAASSLGRAKGDQDAIKKKIIAIAYRKGGEFVAKLPDGWKKKKDQKNASLFARMMSAFRAEQAPEEMSDNDVRRNLLDALREDDKTVNYVEAFYPNVEPATVVYSCWAPSTSCGPEMGMGYQSCMYQRSYSVDSNGVVTLGTDIVEVEPVLTYQAVPDASPEMVAAGAPKTAVGAPCSCQTHNKDTRGAADMKKEELVKFLETATDEQVKALSAAIETPAVVETPKVETPAVETPKTAEAAKTPSFEEILATAEPSVRDAIAEGQRVGSEKRATTIKALKDTGRCDLTDKELAALSQAQLDQLVKLAGAPKVDFSAAGASRPQVESQVIPEAPSMIDAIKAARGTK